MPKYSVSICMPTGNGWIRAEVGIFLWETAAVCLSDPEIAPLINNCNICPLQKFPTDQSRNTLVERFKNDNDFIMMVDSDAVPAPGTFKAFFNFLRQQPEPSVVAAPYVAGDGKVMAFTFVTSQATKEPMNTFALTNIDREYAVNLTGAHRVHSIGTHVIMYNSAVFNKIPKPYFAYSYNADRTSVIETEDCYCMRSFFNAGIPTYAHFDYWASHVKETRLDKPPRLTQEEVQSYFINKAKGILIHEQEEALKKASKPPEQPKIYIGNPADGKTGVDLHEIVDANKDRIPADDEQKN